MNRVQEKADMGFGLVAPIRISHRKMSENAAHDFQEIQIKAEQDYIKINIWDTREEIWFDYFVAGQSLREDAQTLTVQFESEEDGHEVPRNIHFKSVQDYQHFLRDFAAANKQLT